ncbi:hypothetical protein Hanom_Chr16g01486671 [Helianthus anomalus]
MGECRLKINIARFAVENSGVYAHNPEKARVPGVQGQSYVNVPGNLRDSRSYSFVVGLLRIAKVVVANIQYLGGLALLITFHDKDSADRFLDSKDLWGPWFSRLDGWSGPSVCRVGVLVSEADRINEGVSVRWKNRSYRIWVEEDPNDWIPDSLGPVVSPVSVEGSSPISSLLKSLGGDGVVSHANCSPMHADRENGCDNNEVGTGSGPVEVENPCLNSKVVGLEVVGSFLCVSGERNNRPTRRKRSGLFF